MVVAADCLIPATAQGVDSQIRHQGRMALSLMQQELGTSGRWQQEAVQQIGETLGTHYAMPATNQFARHSTH